MAAGDGNFFQAVTLIKMDAGESGSFLINNNTVDITITGDMGAGTYSPLPEVKVSLPERSGGLEESDCEIDIGDSPAFVKRLISGHVFAPVSVDIYEYFFDEVNDSASKIIHMFSGKMIRAFSNVNEVEGMVRIIANNSKNRLNVVLGVSANVQCSWSLGDKNCKATVITLDRTVASISNTVMEVSEAPDPGTYPSSLFKKGYVKRNDVRILIREWITGDTFYLARAVPPDWLGQTVTLVSGCDRSLSTCTEIYNNTLRFAGIGALMTEFNPIYEEP